MHCHYNKLTFHNSLCLSGCNPVTEINVAVYVSAYHVVYVETFFSVSPSHSFFVCFSCFHFTSLKLEVLLRARHKELPAEGEEKIMFCLKIPGFVAELRQLENVLLSC